jgi:hypothetical protein
MLVCLLVLTGAAPAFAHATPRAHAVIAPVIIPDPGPTPLLEDEWVFCGPGVPLHLGVHTIPGAAYAVWTYDYNPTLGFFTSYAGMIIAHADPDFTLITPGETIPQPPGVKDEILLVYVYGLAHSYPGGGNEPLIAYPPDTHCGP